MTMIGGKTRLQHLSNKQNVVCMLRSCQQSDSPPPTPALHYSCTMKLLPLRSDRCSSLWMLRSPTWGSPFRCEACTSLQPDALRSSNWLHWAPPGDEGSQGVLINLQKHVCLQDYPSLTSGTYTRHAAPDVRSQQVDLSVSHHETMTAFTIPSRRRPHVVGSSHLRILVEKIIYFECWRGKESVAVVEYGLWWGK